jgi:P-type Cu+ transporter
MTLEPLVPTLEEGDRELDDFRRRFWWFLPLTVVVTLLAMFGHRAGGCSRVPKAGWSCFLRHP